MSDQLSVCKIIKEVYEIPINDIKVQLADEIGWLLNSYGDWYSDDEFLKNTELGNFLNFVLKIR